MSGSRNADRLTAKSESNGRGCPDGQPLPHGKEMYTMSKYQEFDSEIFEATKIMIGFSLTDGQKTELLKIAGEIEAACRDGSLSDDERQQLLDTMADCGLELPQPPTEPGVDEAKLQERLAKYISNFG